MDSFKIYDQAYLATLFSPRPGEVKIGERVQLARSLDSLAESNARFVLLGIPEDIGVRANHGIGGADTTWLPALSALLNMQSNAFMDGNEILVLGAFDIAEPADCSIDELRRKVQMIDQLVYPVIEKIIASGKIPVVVGGGHNNAYGLIRGASVALKCRVNVVNIDAHTDLRPAEGRHSGNGFRYALEEGYLENYRIFGLAENYVHAHLIPLIQKNEQIRAVWFMDLLKSREPVIKHWKTFMEDMPEPCGLEIDADSISGVLSSAVTPSGFALNDIRTILLSGRHFCYMHLCEGAVRLDDGREDRNTAKAIAFLISDFIAAHRD